MRRFAVSNITLPINNVTALAIEVGSISGPKLMSMAKAFVLRTRTAEAATIQTFTAFMTFPLRSWTHR